MVIYPSRKVEQNQTHPYRALLKSDQMHRVYLNELGEISQMPLGVALMTLTTVNKVDAPFVAQELLVRSRQQVSDKALSDAIMDIITTIMMYRFTSQPIGN